MKHFHKLEKNYFEPELVEITLNPNIILPKPQPSTSSSSSANHAYRNFKNRYSHKKINSANNQYSKIKNNKRLQFNNPSPSQSISSIQTPEINTRYKLKLERLNTNIYYLKNKYADLLKEHFETNDTINDYKIRFIKLKKQNDKEKKIKKRQQFLKVNGEKIKKFREEEKRYIKEGKENQQNNKIKELENRKKKELEKKQKTAEAMQGNKFYALKKMKNDLESKIKIQTNINNKIKREYPKYFNKKINEIIKNSD